MMPRKLHPAENIKLIPAADFQKIAMRVFSVSKAESDRQMAASRSKSARRKSK